MICAFEDFNKHPSLVKKLILADTSFIRYCNDHASRFHSETRTFLESNRDTTLCFNVTVKQELTHSIRLSLLINEIDRSSYPFWFKRICNDYGQRLAKTILRSREKGAKLISVALKGRLKSEIAKITVGFTYKKASDSAAVVDWEDALKIIEEYSLDV